MMLKMKGHAHSTRSKTQSVTFIYGMGLHLYYMNTFENRLFNEFCTPFINNVWPVKQ